MLALCDSNASGFHVLPRKLWLVCTGTTDNSSMARKALKQELKTILCTELEKLQRKAVRFCAGNYSPYASMTEMLQEVNWDTLVTRRKTVRLSFMYKLSHNLTDFPAENHLKPNNEKRTRGSHYFKFLVCRAKKDSF